jgi:serine protease Do
MAFNYLLKKGFYMKLRQIMFVFFMGIVPLSSNMRADEMLHKSGSPWRNINSDAIVQVFTQHAEFDFFQPYRTPDTYTGRASGFFIYYENQLYIMTNAHATAEAFGIWIQVPRLGKRLVKVNLVSIYPEKDFALLSIHEDDLPLMQQAFEGTIPYLLLGDSDSVRRTDRVLALGYPLGEESLKSTMGIVSGRHYVFGSKMIQVDTAINPGNSGGPILNEDGFVIGINAAKRTDAENTNYSIPINDLKKALPDMIKDPLIKKPFLGLLTHNVDDYVTAHLGNPMPGGCYVTEVAHNGPLERAGIKQGDMIYEINGYRADVYHDLEIPWSEDKLSVVDYISQLGIGEKIHLVVYRNGERLEFTLKAEFTETSHIKRLFPWHETPEFEIFAGMVIMPLTENHIQKIGNNVPGLQRYSIFNTQKDPVLIISHIFGNSQLACTRAIFPGYTIKEINGIEVKTLDDFRAAVTGAIETGIVHIRARDEVTASTDNIIAVLPLKTVVEETVELAQMYRYPVSAFVQDLASMLEEN